MTEINITVEPEAEPEAEPETTNEAEETVAEESAIEQDDVQWLVERLDAHDATQTQQSSTLAELLIFCRETMEMLAAFRLEMEEKFSLITNPLPAIVVQDTSIQPMLEPEMVETVEPENDAVDHAEPPVAETKVHRKRVLI